MTTDPQPAPTPTDTPLPDPGQPALGTQPPQAPQPSAAPPEQLPYHQIKRTRISGLWVAVGFFAVVLLLLLIFILQNSAKVDVSYMGAHGHLPLGVAMLLAAVCGVLLVVLAGAARISQLRATARKHRRADARRVKVSGGQPQRPSRLGASRAGPLTGIAPVAAAVSGVLLGGPAPRPLVWAGIAVVAAGLTLGLRKGET